MGAVRRETMVAMNENSELITSQTPQMQELVRTACVFESLQRQAPMESGDLRVQETAAELILFMEPGTRVGPLTD